MDFKNKKIPLMIILAALLGVGVYFYKQATVEKGVVLYGNVDVRQVSLAFQGADRIEQMLVEEGASVKKGDVLATLKTDALKLAIRQTKAQILAQEAIVEKMHNGSRPQEIAAAAARQREAEAAYTNVRLYNERMQSLYSQSAISKQQSDDAQAKYQAAASVLDSARASYDLAVAGARSEDIKQAEGQLAVLEAGLALQEYNLEQAQLVAPMDGVVRSRLAEPGDMASPQRPVYMLTTLGKKWVRAYVSETQLGLIKPGMQAQVIIDSFPDKPLTGEVGYISNTAEFTPKSVQTPELRTSLLYEVRVYVDDSDDVLRMGMPATVKF